MATGKWLGVLLLAAAGLGGCAQPAGPVFGDAPADLVWPAPPEPPRIRYLGSLTGEADLQGQVSLGESLQRVFFGRADVGVLVSPYAVLLAGNGRLFAADTGGGTIHVMDLETRQYEQFGPELDDGAALRSPIALALLDGKLLVADSALGCVAVFDEQGRFRFTFGTDVLQRPAGMAADTTRQVVYVADAAQHRVFVFDGQGEAVRTLGTRGSGPGQFNFPTQVCVDGAGNLWVSDTLNYRVQGFDAAGRYRLEFGRQGDRPGCFAHPGGIAVDAHGHIYVADRQFENVQIFDQQGRILLAFGGEGHEPGRFWLPGGLWIDGQDRVFVADSFNKRVQVFQLLELADDETQTP